MTTPTKIISASFLILLGCLPWISMLVFFLCQSQVREHMKEELEESMYMHTVVLTNSDIIWVEKNKEILVNGTMFDIKTMESLGGYTKFTGLYDHEETALKKQLQRGWQNQNESSNKVLGNFLQLFQQVILADNEEDENVFLSSPIKYRQVKTTLPDRYTSILTPPPRCA